MKQNKKLKKFYDKVYLKGEKKHFTTYRESSSTSEIKEVLKQISWKSKSVLDVGCGTGYFAYSVAKKGANVLGIDFSIEAIQIAKSQYIHPNLEFKAIDVSKIKEKFDVIVSNGTLEHMDNPLRTLKLFKNHLNPNGCIIITSPNWTNPRGYILLTLLFLFKAPITLVDLHYFTPIDFQNFAKKLKMKLNWKTFDRSWGHGDVLIKDLEKRLPNVLHDAKLPNNKKQIALFLKWIKTNIVSLNNDQLHSGATGMYVFSFN
ncbi:2-polyprenyl-3-methyl-5-hydroxy-6-metoxy-1,4-benzoquinol methylase [Candidatus Nitrosarchaeum limnium SFB1]|uniref:2-polyprenyl-3-methyl-5-hydroxy-6-metoxy-1, 4-benzoquinol methylase n=1 Tax=Candidatus Nitrosarchaeum limnium SFB1 TaxID=886738 RepID=F3KN03_9ARCH|nr:2-polyprenyl-3-methyl-5-hydroxy-6-metoxy-1,4-benzoquinol methylase [Candidatus Nitrosarchaeum limnium SFB1]